MFPRLVQRLKLLRKPRVAVAIVFAVLVIATGLTWLSPSGDGVPRGWDRPDYIAYLALSDQLKDATKGDQPFIACISNDIGVGDLHHVDPSRQLMAALQSEFADHPHASLRLASACRQKNGHPEETATGKPAVWVYAEIDMIQTGDCGPYAVGWHIAPLNGGSFRYHIVPDRKPIELVRDAGCDWVE